LASGRAPGVNDLSYYSISFPAAYDGSTPTRMLWAFHSTGDNNNEPKVYYGQSALARDYVMVYPQWTDYETDKARLDGMWQEIADKYCVDLAHVFATGYAGGAQVIMQMLCDNDSRFAAVAPIAGSGYCTTVPPIPVLYMGPRKDTGRVTGIHEQVAEMFATSNGCSDSTPYSAIMGCSVGTYEVDPGCVEYQGCSKPTLFCAFSKPSVSIGYDPRPCFGTTAMYDFFKTIP
jgi:hypothetical protein